jgi:bis(5'-nucleosyl)-tetraphosphatase (symmetrical)
MATYAIGDIQGCYDQLRRLLDSFAFDPANDTLWLVGDLVNRGPQSLETLQFIRSLGERAVTVLGNHDLNLLAVAAGVRKRHRGDTIGDILESPERDELVWWLRTRQLFHAGDGYAMVHAGLPPQWTIARARELAAEVEAVLRSDAHVELVTQMYGNSPVAWDDALEGYERLRVIINAMSRLRLCDVEGRMEFTHKVGPVDMPEGYMPWYEVPGRESAGTPLVCGHWAALGLMLTSDVLSIDTGCVWGRTLTALRLEDRRLFQCDCAALEGKAEE